MKRTAVILLFILSFVTSAFSQSDDQDEPEKKKRVYKKDVFGVGGAGAANLTIFQLGFNARLYFPLSKRLNLVPEFYRYGNPSEHNPSALMINEYYLALNLNLKLFNKKRTTIYGGFGYLFTQWINWDENGSASFNGAQFCLGAEYNLGKISLFLEASTNTVYFELNTFLGIKTNIAPKKMFRFKKHHNNILRDGIKD